MTLIKCKECDSQISSVATTCPKCGKPNVSSGASSISGLFALGLLIGAAWFFLDGGWDSLTKGTLSGIQDQVARDSEAQYYIAAAQGDKMQICVQAGVVAAAYLQAQDSQNYNVWKGREQLHCAAAGISR